MPAAQEEFNSIMSLGQEVARLGGGIENPYTIITMDVCLSFTSFFLWFKPKVMHDLATSKKYRKGCRL